MMTLKPPSVELDELVDVQCEGTLSDEQAARIEELVADDAALRHRYIVYLHVHACAERKLKASKDRMASRAVEVDAIGISALSAVPSSDASASELPFVIHTPTLGLSHDITHSPLGYSLQAWSLSYLVASVLLCVGLFVASLVHTSIPEQEPTRTPTAPLARLHSQPRTIGRVSGLANCEWSDSRDKTRDRAVVRIGQKYSLAAGFLELTYNSGAKIILQGPCVYRVDSPCSGFLEVGKLTANVGARGEGRGTREVASGQWSVASDGRGERGEISDEWRVASGENSGHSSPQPLASSPPSNPQSLISNPLFTITTPTAIVTDLGTEFGVEVEKSGATRSHVFKGRVQVRNSNSRGPTARGDASRNSATAAPDAVIELTAGQSASVSSNDDGKAKVVREARSEPSRFVRTMPRAKFGGILRGVSIDNWPGDPARLGENVAYACEINAVGQVVPYSPTIAGASHVFRYRAGEVIGVGSLLSGDGSPSAGEMFDRSYAAITSNGPLRAFVHVPGEGLKDLGMFGNPVARATGINTARQVVGGAVTATGAIHAFLYDGGKMRDLGTLGGEESYASDINAAGWVVGGSRNADGTTHAFLYTPAAGMKDLGALGGPKASSWAVGIDDVGQVSGCSEVEGGHWHAFRYSERRGMQDLGDIGDGDRTIRCTNGRMSIDGVRTGPLAEPDAPLHRAGTPDSRPPVDRKERRTSS